MDTETVQRALWLSVIKGFSDDEVFIATGYTRHQMYQIRHQHGIEEKVPYQGVCGRCHILLNSQFAGMHDGEHCEGCLREMIL